MSDEKTNGADVADDAKVIAINAISLDQFTRTLKGTDCELIVPFVHIERLRKTRRLPLNDWQAEFEKFKRAPRV